MVRDGGGEVVRVRSNEVDEAVDDGLAGDLGSPGPNLPMPEPREGLVELGRLGRRVELRGPSEVEVGARGRRGAGEARVVDMVVDDENTALGFQHPDAAVGNELPEAVPAKESIEALLPDVPGISPTRHVALDEEDVAAAVGPVGLVLLSEVVQPRRPSGSSMPGGTPK